MLADKQRLGSMSESGFEAWKKSFTWQGIAAQYEQTYKRVLAAD
jgi:hypothetical protein